MASVQVAINVVGLDSKLGFSSNATHALTGKGHSANVVTVAGTEYELDLSGVGDGIFVWTEGALPGGLVDGTRYVVKTVDGMDVTLEDGASTLDVTSAGTGPHWAVEAEAVAACPVSYLYSEA